jgi:undecaprenyldiphospho-muramoylpentapeptide beta-N-acetylglucosaminyltransferase
MRLLICAGGTGGGVYPALSVLQALQSRIEPGAESGLDEQPEVQTAAQAGVLSAEAQNTVLWVGGIGGMEADLVKRAGVRFEAIPAGQVHGISLRSLPGSLWQLGRGFLAARRVLRKFRPDVLFFTGGYLAVPVALAARLLRQGKNLLYVPDIEPGWALKTLARFAHQVALTVEDSRQFFKRHQNVVVTGYPLRPGLQAWNKTAARAAFALRERLPVVLMLGGSKGAHSINQALQAILPDLLRQVQVLHISGNLEWALVEQSRKSLPVELQARYRAYPYLHKEMGAALQAADLVVSRAGASVLGEYPLFGLPAILVPYPYAWRYQRVNAQYLVRQGAAVLLEDAELGEQLLPRIQELLANRERREGMRAASKALARPNAAGEIARLLQDLATGNGAASAAGEARV